MATPLTVGVTAHATTGTAPTSSSNTLLGHMLQARTVRRLHPPKVALKADVTVARQQAIENALCMALHYIRTTNTPQGIQAATAKAVRAASMLKDACTASSNTPVLTTVGVAA